MSDLFGAAVLTIECPQCGHRMKETMTHLRSSPQLLCTGCESRLQVQGEQLDEALTKLSAATKALSDGGVRKLL